MSSRFVRLAPLVPSLILFWSTGCTTVAKQGLHEVIGARAKVLLNTELSDTALARYQSVRFEPATTKLSNKLCPPKVLTAYDHFAGELPHDLDALYAGGSPGLTIETEILFFQKKGLLGGAQLLSRIQFRGDDGFSADGIVNAASKSFREGSGDDLAEAAIDAVGKLLKRQKAE
ncbi:MAG: hypothetical protein KAY37_16745 [Phycisphaerae bacterium]|nr:hypothetical protein [Phycisphaerae bacterium]